ncbi:MAG: C2H2-type zinc finger protein, partial [Blautia sp.]|nr:C2H2-type zinc finger protein [Blautia sp.]
LDKVTGGEGTGSFVCSKCGEVFSSAADFAEHMKVVHHNRYVCPVCGAVFGTGTAIAEHMGKNHPRRS